MTGHSLRMPESSRSTPVWARIGCSPRLPKSRHSSPSASETRSFGLCPQMILHIRKVKGDGRFFQQSGKLRETLLIQTPSEPASWAQGVPQLLLTPNKLW